MWVYGFMARGLGLVVEGTLNVRGFASVGYENIEVHVSGLGLGFWGVGSRLWVYGLWLRL